LTTTSLVVAHMRAGAHSEAIAVADDLIEKANTIANPWAVSYALMIYGMACCDADAAAARDALRRALVIAQESGDRGNESLLAASLSRLEAEHADPLAALGHITLVIRNYHDAGNITLILSPLAFLAALFDRLGRYEPAATIAGLAFNPLTAATLPEITTAIAHLRDVLGNQTYQPLARTGEMMTVAAMVAFAYDQIDQARAELNSVSK
jgi:tetratricopeptide (TPR) repeat protein